MIPQFLYGTAWKGDQTAALTRLALDQGFRAIDTANQRKHYHEAGVGEGLASAIADGVVTRDQVFLQTKFTHIAGQDHRLPYDRHADPATQVEQSFNRSLQHLGVAALDAYLLHGPSLREGWSREDRLVWGAMERLHASGKTRYLGVSNVSLAQVEELCAFATVRPTFVQNRCYASRGWDAGVRLSCVAHGLTYQGFSLLTANGPALGSSAVLAASRRLGATPAQVVFAFARHVGMLPLTGTTDPQHMQDDLRALDLSLSEAEVGAIERV